MAQYMLYKLYAKAMYSISLRITNDQNDAEDVLQESFLSAFKNIEAYKGSATFGAWLKKIVVNKAINVVRKRRLAMISLEEHDICEEDTDSNEDTSYKVEQVKKAIQLLPDGFRIVLSLYLLEGYDHNEIADIMHITASTSKSQFNRAKKRLKEILVNQEISY